MKTKSIQIDENLHTQIKEYCNEKGLKIQKYIENTVKNELSKDIQRNLSKSKK